MKDIIIWGAGNLGKMAWTFYKDRYNIIAFIDSDVNKIGSYFEGIPIESSDILLSRGNVTVVVPCNKYTDEICELLIRKYRIDGVLLFEMHESIYMIPMRDDVTENEMIVSFKGGLGNQLFQYAFMEYFIKQGIESSADLSYYISPEARKFDIEEAFPKVKIKRCSNKLRKCYMEEGGNYYKEPDVCENWKNYPVNMFKNFNYGYVDGYFQSRFFPNETKVQLYSQLRFAEPNDSSYKRLKMVIESCNSVAIHIRRGDYLSAENDTIYGGICTEQYYNKAMEYIADLEKNILWVFFSNDIKWVRERYDYKNAIYVASDMFENYKDWYDMALMSCCHHNIIANSTFSWWGAWLNRNDNKIVIAPHKWMNYDSMLDICPMDWIRL